MKKQIPRFALYVVIVYLTVTTFNIAGIASQPSWGNGTHFHGVTDSQWNKRYSDQFPNRHYARSLAANLNVGDPRTVRLIYFLPNNWQYRADVVQQMKDTIRTVQTFYAEQMEAHGYGKGTFHFETDSQGEPMVHRVDGQHPFSYYDNTLGSKVFSELEQAFDFNANIYFIVLGTDALRQGDGQPAGGVGYRFAKNGGVFLVPNEFSWDTVAHELGHTFGLNHDFRDDKYIMSYGLGPYQLSSCAAEYLSVHSYFNPDIPTEEEQPPTVELISPRRYPPGSTSVPVQVQVGDSDGLHQVLLHAVGALQLCRTLTGKKDAIVEFEYDGGFGIRGFESFSSAVTHRIRVDIIDTDGNVSNTHFTLAESSPYHITTFDEHTAAVRSVSFSPDGILASGSEDRTVRLWGVVTQQNITTLTHEGPVESVVFSRDGTLASATGYGTIRLWDVATETNFVTLMPGHWIYDVSFSSDGGTLAWGTSAGAVKLWDVLTEVDIDTLTHGNHIFSVSFFDAGILASGGEDRTVKLWDVETRQNITTLAHEDIVLSVSFSPDGTILASGGWGEIEFWDVATETNFATLRHGATVSSVSFSPDGTILASGSWDSTVKLWDVMTSASVVTFLNTGPVYSVSFSPDGTILASGTADGTVEIWDTSEVMQLRAEALTEVDIPDPNLRAAIAEVIGVPPSTSIVRGHLEKLTRLDAWEANISNLSGLEHAINLTRLELRGNNISDISVLAGLTNLISLHLSLNNILDISVLAGLAKLEHLYLEFTSISDIAVLAGLINLRTLDLRLNNISDISVLAGLTNLTSLNLGENNILDISVLAGLTNLTWLRLDGNSISDISSVAGLTELTWLELGLNNISDLSPLVTNMGLGNGDEVYVKGNPLSYLSIHTHIPTLQSSGITVEFDNQAHPALLKISGDNQKGASFTSLSQPFVVEAQDANGSALAGISVTFAVIAGGGTLSTTITSTDENGRAQSTLILGPNLGTNTVEVSATNIESSATFYAIADSELPPRAADVNSDGSVNVLDLILIASSIGQAGQNAADVNGDRVVSILDLVLAAGMFDDAAAAPSAQRQVPETLTAVEIQGWLTDARSLKAKDSIMKRGIVVLEQLLVSLTPTKTELLANYPNPFNPETWIPYRLAEDAFVTLTIYDGSGRLIRTLDVGHRIAAAYESQSKAIYWNGKNNLGEQVASGVYFYTLTAGDYSATRKMVIFK